MSWTMMRFGEEAIVGAVRAAGFPRSRLRVRARILVVPATGRRGYLVLDVEMPELNGLSIYNDA